MKRIEKVFEEMGINCKIEGHDVLVEFWTDTAGQDIPVEFEFDGTPEGFVKEFSAYAENYDVDEEVENYSHVRGENGVPNTIRELLADCQEAKDTLMGIAKKLKAALNGVSESKHILDDMPTIEVISKADMVTLLKELQAEVEEEAWQQGCIPNYEREDEAYRIRNLIQKKISKLIFNKVIDIDEDRV